MSASGFINQNNCGASLLASTEVVCNLRVWGAGESGDTDALTVVNALNGEPFTQKNSMRVLGGGAVKVDCSVANPAGQPSATLVMRSENQATDAGSNQFSQILEGAGIVESIITANAGSGPGQWNQMVVKGLYDPSEAYPGLVLQVSPDPWRSDVTYNTGDLVFYLTLTYSSVTNNNQGHSPLNDSSFWAVYTVNTSSTGGYAQVRGNLTTTGTSTLLNDVTVGSVAPAPPVEMTINGDLTVTGNIFSNVSTPGFVTVAGPVIQTGPGQAGDGLLWDHANATLNPLYYNKSGAYRILLKAESNTGTPLSILNNYVLSYTWQWDSTTSTGVVYALGTVTTGTGNAYMGLLGYSDNSQVNGYIIYISPNNATLLLNNPASTIWVAQNNAPGGGNNDCVSQIIGIQQA